MTGKQRTPIFHSNDRLPASTYLFNGLVVDGAHFDPLKWNHPVWVMNKIKLPRLIGRVYDLFNDLDPRIENNCDSIAVWRLISFVVRLNVIARVYCQQDATRLLVVCLTVALRIPVHFNALQVRSMLNSSAAHAFRL